jgi:hypothetical protein
MINFGDVQRISWHFSTNLPMGNVQRRKTQYSSKNVTSGQQRVIALYIVTLEINYQSILTN